MIRACGLASGEGEGGLVEIVVISCLVELAPSVGLCLNSCGTARTGA